MRDPTSVLVIAVLAAACNPYLAAVGVVSQTYGAATDVRPVSVQLSDDEIEAKIKADLVASPVAGTGSLSAYCRQGVVVLAGVVPPGSDAGRAAVRIARSVAGVERVETFFVDAEPDEAADVELEAKVKAALVGDPHVVSGQVDVDVFSGHVILVGVASSADQIDEFVADARSVSGVRSVRSYIQLPD
jgi:hyperosmotically inducible protein